MTGRIILMVEDDPDHEELAMHAFRESKILNEVVVVRDGEEALDWLFGTGSYSERDLSVMPDVVLLDLKLPKIDGLEVLRRARAHPQTRSLPVVILTSSDEERDIVNAYALGANSYIRKPVDFRQFVEAVGQLGLYWLVLNQPASTHRKGERRG